MSRRVSRFLAFLLFSSSIGVAAAAPRVITGIGEREAGRLFPAAPAEEPAQEQAYVAPFPTRARLAPPPPAPAYVEPRSAPQPRLVTARAEPTVAPGAYGGGFIELLVTGQTPEPQARRRVAALGAGEANVQRQIDPVFLRAEVDYAGAERAGTIVIDSSNKFLYLVQGGGRALRYGIGVGRPGFTWAGVKTISRKAEWPDWTPPGEMLARRPDLPRHMVGGPANPLGARAMYLGSSLYRIHGTNEPYTIGQNVSSGCIRMMNDDVVDLYDRVHVGTKVVVR
ncbi:L,D-transpeptidase [Methylosinus sporium]|uniref:L,D-transpeptidase n=1 Tax=Methylosinus sporium TaxID=428 RepID=A0A2U1SSK0_METSR|nr:L,D-transpeptidase [Methylosinus sporium]PWB94589.1 L,D-transpeptidase [Methylosinus sporium]